MQWDTVTGYDEKRNPLPGNRVAEIIPQQIKCSFKLAPGTEVIDVNCLPYVPFVGVRWTYVACMLHVATES
jgi:hypothetical protein